MMTLVFVVNAAIVTGSAALMWWIPVWTRPRHFFSVTVEPGFAAADVGRRILRRYRTNLLLIASATMMVSLLSKLFLFRGGILLCALAEIVAFASARRSVKPYASPAPTNLIRETVIETPQPRLFPGVLLWAIGPLLILSATAFYLFLHWRQIPDPIPGHWGPGGQPDRWIARTPAHVFRRLYPEAYGCLLILLICAGMVRGSRGPLGMKRINSWGLVGVAYYLSLLGSWIALHPLPLGENLSRWMFPFFLAPGIWLAALFWYAAKHGMLPNAGPGRLRVLSPSSSVTDQMPDNRWKAGLFYYNPDDPALFVEARSGVGLVLNIARPAAWTLLILALLPLAGIPLLFRS